MGQQMEFGLKISYKFKPNALQLEPPLWIEEIRVYRSFNPDALQRAYTLRPGMNILWADPGQGNANLYASGISGHAAGKTTFCRLLRYLLGEPDAGTKRFRGHVAGWAPDARLVGKVWLNGVSWVICRPLAAAEVEFAVKTGCIEDVFNSVLPRQEYEVFFQAVEKQGCGELLGRSLPSGDRQISWRRLLPWISRDQECRLSKLTVWRDPVTESQTPETTLADACYIIRCALKLVSDDEDRLYKQHRQLLEKRKKYEIDIPLLNYQAEQGLHRLKVLINDFAQEGDILISVCRKTLNADLQKLENTLDIQLQKKRLQEADDELASAREKKTIAVMKLQEHEKLLIIDRQYLSVLKGDFKKEQARQEMDDNDPAPANRCNVPLHIARREGCELARGVRPDFETHKNLMTLDEKLAAYEEQIALMEADVANLREQVTVASGRVEAKLAEYRRIQVVHDSMSSDLERHKWDVRQRLKELEDIETTKRTSETKEAQLETIRKDEKESQTQLNELRRKAQMQKTRINDLFEDITRAVLGREVNASFMDYADHIDLDVQCRGDRESSATSTVQILAFDLAALLLGAEGESIHPGLLIHDSPREADMAPDVYQRFFLYLREVEKAYGNRPPNYQYIVTTTEPPPADVIQKPWLIARLDASKPETRLLGVDLV